MGKTALRTSYTSELRVDRTRQSGVRLEGTAGKHGQAWSVTLWGMSLTSSNRIAVRHHLEENVTSKKTSYFAKSGSMGLTS